MLQQLKFVILLLTFSDQIFVRSQFCDRSLKVQLMEQNPAWKVNGCLTSREIFDHLKDTKAHYNVHNNPPMFPDYTENLV
jgi:hypothetical protein